MLMLAGANDKYSLIASSVGDIDVTAHFMDATTADPPVVKGSSSAPQLTTITTAGTTDIVNAPGAGAIRSVAALTIRNVHATVAQDVTVQLNRSAVLYELWKTNLLPGDVLDYADGFGWVKTSIGDPMVQYARKSAQQSFSSVSFADITGLTFALAANATVEIEAEIIFRSATVTVGVGVGLNGPAGFVSINGTVTIHGQRGVQTAGAEFSAGFVAYDSATPLSTAVEATGTDYVARIRALVENGGTGGTLACRWRSETATATTVEAGSYATVKRLR